MDISRSNRDIAQVAGENRSVAIPSYIQNSKYRRWYEALCDKAKGRPIPACYTEVHHIKPRSLGGSDDPSNLARLTYREHFVAHWLLTKFHTGLNLVKMQKALLAMTMNVSGQRRPTGLQVEAAKRAVRDIELNDEAQAAWYERRKQKRQDKIAAHNAKVVEWERDRNERQWIEALWLSNTHHDPLLGAKFRAECLAIFQAKPAAEFDHELIAKYFDASPEVIQDMRDLHILGPRGVIFKKHRAKLAAGLRR